MQTVKIPLSIEPAKAALKRMTYDGIIVKGNLSRLNEVAEVLTDHVNVSIECGVDPQDLVVIQGTATASLELTCQRCGKGLKAEVTADFVYTPIRNAAKESEDPIPEAYDEIELDEFGAISLVHLVEDELMLALPIVAMHEPKDCELGNKNMSFGELAPEATVQEKPNPFEVLKKLKN